jgi:hypothetical protein
MAELHPPATSLGLEPGSLGSEGTRLDISQTSGIDSLTGLSHVDASMAPSWPFLTSLQVSHVYPRFLGIWLPDPCCPTPKLGRLPCPGGCRQVLSQ